MAQERLTRIALWIVLAAAASAGSIPVRAAEPYQIDAVLALTGPGAFLGKGEQQALELAEKAVNESGGLKGRPLHFVFHDDQTSPQLGVQLTSGLVAKKPAVILGSSLVAICRAQQPLMKNGPVHYCFSPGLHPPPGDYSFSPSVSTTDLADATVRYFRMKGWTRLAFMFSTDATGQEFEEGVKGILAKPENAQMKVVAAEHFATSDVSVSAQIQNVKAANPQAFIAWSTGTPIATIFRGMIQAGLDVPMATTDGNMTYAQMKQYADFLPKRLYIPAGQFIQRDTSGQPPAVAKAHAEFYKAFDAIGAKPDEPSELAWEPAMIVVHALRTLGTEATAAQLHDFLVHLKGYAGADGMYDFEHVPQRGLDVSNAVMTLWSNTAQTWEVVSKPGGEPLP
ncbi:MAG TPA: ABC transporter substrate-binding protein [Alphaproteobacteria bacterium]|nr:ABC transporter substrate-binding protein [Alphaproteobacteria bacterium]